jgi:hypothetical protein
MSLKASVVCLRNLKKKLVIPAKAASPRRTTDLARRSRFILSSSKGRNDDHFGRS